MNPRAWLLLLPVMLAACAGGPQREEPAPIEEAPPPVEDRTGIPERPPQPPATDAFAGLLEQARTARERGETERALAVLERAQRLDPARGTVYLELARTHAAAGNDAQAKAFAERGLLYCSGGECRALARLSR